MKSIILYICLKKQEVSTEDYAEYTVKTTDYNTRFLLRWVKSRRFFEWILD